MLNPMCLELSLGYSHNVFLAVPSEIKVQTVQEKGSNPTIILEGIDKQLIGQVAAKLKDRYVKLSLTKEKVYASQESLYAEKLVRLLLNK